MKPLPSFSLLFRDLLRTSKRRFQQNALRQGEIARHFAVGREPPERIVGFVQLSLQAACLVMGSGQEEERSIRKRLTLNIGPTKAQLSG